jgi:transcriptional regulator with XRE-family HTH domain
MKNKTGRKRKTRSPGIGEYLTKLREERGLTQQQIADKIKRSKSYICRIETGDRDRTSVPQKSLQGFILYELSKAYGADLAEILEIAKRPQLLLLDTTGKERLELVRRLQEIRLRKKR